ncbi:MAG: heterodisulfide reductase-related iron-sulfur binding cluster [Acidobacteriaceae bacterium]
MLPLSQKYAFLIFALVTVAWGTHGFYRLYLRIRRGRPDGDLRTDHVLHRFWVALRTTLSQTRTFKKRTVVSTFHAFIFYGFAFYILVNAVDAIAGYTSFDVSSSTGPGAVYNLLADILSFLVLVGVVALVIRRFFLPARRDFRFNATTLLHPDARHGYISRDSLIVSAFILFHVGSRAIGAGARLAQRGPDKFEPFATALSHLFTPQNAHAWRIFGYWGALGSVLLFLAYFPYTKHVHILMAPVKYFFARRSGSGVLPLVEIAMEAEDDGAEMPQMGAKRLEDLAWPRLLDAYACIQCNRCQDVCPATATGKSLSPAALEINKRMELNRLSASNSGFETGAESPHPLLQFAMTTEAAWGCTTCGACMQVCPVQDEQMLDIIDIRRNQVMMEGKFPAQLQAAFRGMERSKNPWGINHDKRMEWAQGLPVKTTDENPDADVLYWVGCAASYDPQAQKTARAFVQLLNYAGVNFAVLGKKECCTGDSARRAGNELLYRELADRNVATLNAVKPKLIVASCPHCMNAIGNEYRQIGGSYTAMHHTQYLESLVSTGKLDAGKLDASITYHDPCYLGRHNGVYDAPRNVLRVLGNELLEMDRSRENAFCCGAGGAQFWKEEEPGTERISENRFDEVKQRLSSATHQKTLAVGCPFCKSMLGSTPGKSDADGIAIKDVAELLLEAVQKKMGVALVTASNEVQASQPSGGATAVVIEHAKISDAPGTSDLEPPDIPVKVEPAGTESIQGCPTVEAPKKVERKKWRPAGKPSTATLELVPLRVDAPSRAGEVKQPESATINTMSTEQPATTTAASAETVNPVAPERKKWQPKPKDGAKA